MGSAMKAWWIAGGSVLAIGLGIFVLSRPESVEVSLITAELGTVESTVANTRAGTVEACQRSRLSLPIGGQIDTILVSEGDEVAEGQLLVTLWNRDRKARVDEAAAAANSAENDSRGLCIAASSDQREAERLVGLASRQLVSEESVDLAVSRAESSSAQCSAAKARQEQAVASREVARAIYEQTELRAPFAGTVAEITGKVGEYATPSPPGVPTPPMIDLMTDDCHYISAPLDEVDAAAIQVGMPVRVSLDAFRNQPFAATVTRIAPYVLDFEKQARTVEIEAEFNALTEATRMLAGYSADVEIILEIREAVLRIPSELLIDSRFVLVVNDRNVLEKREVTTGISNWRFTEITSGLSADDTVVANIGSAGVVEGARVEVIDEPLAVRGTTGR